MNKNAPSTNTRRAADEKAEIKSIAQELKEANDKLEAERTADPNWTAVITHRDDKTTARRWVRTDELDNSII
jgi:hypothetical protein